MRVPLSVPWAIVVAAVIIGASVIAAQVLAPYRVSGGADGTWRLNSITGEMQICSIAFSGCRAPAFR